MEITRSYLGVNAIVCYLLLYSLALRSLLPLLNNIYLNVIMLYLVVNM